MTEKRFRTGKGIFEEGYPSETIIDNETGKTYYKGYAYHKSSKEICELLNKFVEENEQLKQVLGSILIEVRRDISATNHSGEVKAFVNPNSFDLISNVLKKYGALKDWYE